MKKKPLFVRYVVHIWKCFVSMLFCLVLVSCKQETLQDKAEKAVKAYIEERLVVANSYEPVSFEPYDSLFVSPLYEEFGYKKDNPTLYLYQKRDSDTSKFSGYISIKHKYIAKNKFNAPLNENDEFHIKLSNLNVVYSSINEK